MDSQLEKAYPSDIEANDDNKPVMVKVEDVSMVFNMASEQFTNLKEYALALAKRELHFKEFRALNHVSFEVRKGDVFGIMGTNGSGKSTVLKIIAGVLDPTTGSCKVNGNIAPLIELGAGFDMELTARENVYLNGALLGYSKDFIDEHFDEIIDFAEVRDFLDIPMKNYSSGMISRIAFAIATVIVPEILVCDEVLSVGDFMFQKKCENRIRQLIDEYGVTVLIVSHSNDQIARLCNKAIWIEKGHTRMLGDAKDVCRVYGSLGGRTGSKEAEAKILEKMLSMSQEPKALDMVGANNSFELLATTTRNFSAGKENCSAIVYSNATHINALFGAQFAGALDAYLLSCEPIGLPTPTLLALNMHQPHTIYLIDCGSSSIRARKELEQLPWTPQVIDLSGSGDPTAYSIELLDYGVKHRLFSDSAIVLDFTDDVIAMVLAPFARLKRYPFLVLWSDNADFRKETLEDVIPLFQSGGMQHVIAAGNSLPDTLVDSLRRKIDVIDIARNENDDANRAFLAAEALLPMVRKDGQSIHGYIAPLDPGQRIYLPAACNEISKPSILLLCNMVDMDCLVSILDFLEENRASFSGITFLGSDNAFFAEDCLLIASALDAQD